MHITGIEEREKGTLVVSLDGVPTLTLAKEIAAARAIKVGVELLPEDVLSLSKADDLYRSHQVALRYLGYRPRSEREVKERLRRGGFKLDVIEKELSKLRALSLVDDVKFAESWKEGRETSRPRSRRVMRIELQRKGVDSEVVKGVVAGIDEEAGAYQVAAKKARTVSGLDEKEFSRRLGQFLQRRGYGYDLSRRVAERLWQEQGGTGPESP